MTFYVNYCEARYNQREGYEPTNRKILIYTILFELFIVVMLRVISTFKNHDITNIKQLLKKNNELKQLVILQTMQTLNTLNQNDLKKSIRNSPNNILNNGFINRTKTNRFNNANSSVYTNSNAVSQSKSMQNSKGNKNNISIVTALANSHNSENQPYHNSESSSESQNDSQLANYSDSLYQTQEDKLGQIIQKRRSFINLYQCKVSFTNASNIFNIVTGHFLVAVLSAMINAPYQNSMIAGVVHAVLFLVLVFVDLGMKNNEGGQKKQIISKEQPISKNENQSRIALRSNYLNGKQKTSQQQPLQIMQFDSRQQLNTQSETYVQKIKQDSNPLSKYLTKGSIKRLVTGLLMLINLFLLYLSVRQTKASYFNMVQQQCQSIY